MINYPELFLFTTLMLVGMVSALYFPAAYIEKRWPFPVSYTHLTLPTNREV